MGGAAYYHSTRTTREIVTQVEVYKSGETTEAGINGEWTKVVASPELAKKLSLTGTKLTVRGSLTDVELDQIKQAVKYPPLLYAVIEGDRQNKREQERLSLEIGQTRNLELFFILAGALLGASGIYFGHTTAQRTRLLREIIANRSDPQKMENFIKQLIESDTGKPQLAWLRTEFKRFHPTL